ncbi:hypothetical protein EDD93_3664 [Streptomyces sp. 840.1]|uniref:hypothetical protein n=1 Tax=Streptomyces sp. 840.1 TaxID=2485152 RepID=UPI000F468B95|nr:hypothetical protein [Streptomyces sp. 840.1]ROQ69167.1 hypothetical protein EDD93_3664 [Streptomyces sp. 840.1]
MATDALPADAIVQAETNYLPPPPRRGQTAQDWSQVPGAELLYRWVETRFGWRVPVPTAFVPDDPGLYARIDDGRWVAECTCGAAWIVSVLDPRFGCAQCQRDWVPLIVPDDIAAAEAEALALVRRFWFHPDDPRNPAPPIPEEPEAPADPAPEEQP